MFEQGRTPIGWEKRRCADTDIELWFGPDEDTAQRETAEERTFRERRAKKLCSECPIVAACLADELRRPLHDQWGVRGGMTASERKTLIRQRAAEVQAA